MILLTGVVLLVQSLSIWAYEPLSEQELRTYWQSITTEERLQEIRKLDILEHSDPEIIIPEYSTMILYNGDLLIMPLGPMIVKIGHLEYKIDLNDVVINEFYINQKTIGDYILPGLFGIGIGVLGPAISSAEKPWQYFISGSCGLGLGLLYAYVRR